MSPTTIPYSICFNLDRRWVTWWFVLPNLKKLALRWCVPKLPSVACWFFVSLIDLKWGEDCWVIKCLRNSELRRAEQCYLLQKYSAQLICYGEPCLSKRGAFPKGGCHVFDYGLPSFFKLWLHFQFCETHRNNYYIYWCEGDLDIRLNMRVIHTSRMEVS